MRASSSPATSARAAGDPLHEAWNRAREALARVQDPRGSFAGEVRWNGMLVCQWVLTMHMLGRPIPADRARRIQRYLAGEVRADGGFPMHPDSGSFMFHTSLTLVTLVVLGCDEDDPLVMGARRWIARHGGAYTVPTWGRVWLAMMGLYPWSHVQPALGLPWLLPRRASLHPSRLYCHLRLIYLGLALVRDRVIRSETSPAFEQLRRWLFPEGDRAERFDARRYEIAATDLYEAPHPLLARALEVGRAVEVRAPSWLRRRFLREALDQIAFEIEHTDGVCLSPVNGMLFCLGLHVHGGRRDLLQRALEGVEYWVWEDEEEGMRVAGARSDTWDTSFVVQSLAELPAPVDPRAAAMAGRARAWLADLQMREDAPGARRFDRSSSIGGWGFADDRHPWPVSDCTAEALEAVLSPASAPDGARSSSRVPVNVTAAARFMLDRQNPDGGFGSYEARRGPTWLSRLNPSEIYGSCMIEASYPECTASCLRGLRVARDAGLEAPLCRAVDAAMSRGVERLRALQRRNGAWEGVWGVHFTYGTFFAVRGLLAAGVDRSDPAITAACAYLRRRQRGDGGWREHCDGLRTGRETSLADAAPSHPTQTAWALLTLMAVSTGPLDPAIQRGLAWLQSSQRADGTWPSPAATGVFFHTAVLDYRLYNLVFPAWALARGVARQHAAAPPA